MDLETLLMWQRIQFCKLFPAYKLHETRDLPTCEVVLPLELMVVAEQARNS